MTGTASYDAPGTKVGGYLARLKGGTKRPAVVVIHKSRGLNPHIKDVARHLAVDGFLVGGGHEDHRPPPPPPS